MGNYNRLPGPVDLNVHTKSPTKWLLVDRETGQVYQGNEGGYWDRLDPNTSRSSNGDAKDN